MDSFFPEKDEFYAIVHFHGGGLIEGDKGDTHSFCEQLANKGYAVFTANYSSLTKDKFPRMLYDAAHAVKYVKENISKYGKCKGLILSGQSAGAWIVQMLCFNKEYLASVGIDDNEIVGWISESGQPTAHFNILKYEKGLSPELEIVDENAPIYYVNKDTRFSNLLLIAYENDIYNRLNQTKTLFEKIKYFDKDTKVTFKVFKGNHCDGSCVLDSNNEYPMINEIDKWVKLIK